MAGYYPQESIYRSLSNECDGKDQRDLTSVEKEILEALEKKGNKKLRNLQWLNS